jgi:phage gp29-like protein
MPSERQKALQALQAIQTDSAVVIPDDMSIELIEAARSGTADYQALYERMDKAISKVVLSQTMTTDDGSSRSQAEVHKGVADWVIKTDSGLLCESFNRGPVAWLSAWNFPSATPPRVKRHTEPAEDLQARAERDNRIFTLGYEPSEQYIEETYGAGWNKKAEPTQPPSDPRGPLPAEFTEISELASRRAGHRADQESLVQAAEYLATQYQALYGKRVEQMLSYLEDTDDVDTFRARLTEMLADVPDELAVGKLRDATWVARLMGRLRGQLRG